MPVKQVGTYASNGYKPRVEENHATLLFHVTSNGKLRQCARKSKARLRRVSAAANLVASASSSAWRRYESASFNELLDWPTRFNAINCREVPSSAILPVLASRPRGGRRAFALASDRRPSGTMNPFSWKREPGCPQARNSRNRRPSAGKFACRSALCCSLDRIPAVAFFAAFLHLSKLYSRSIRHLDT